MSDVVGSQNYEPFKIYGRGEERPFDLGGEDPIVFGAQRWAPVDANGEVTMSAEALRDLCNHVYRLGWRLGALSNQAVRVLRRARAAELASGFDRASRAITGRPAAELNERLTIESRAYGDPFAPTDTAASMGDWDPPSDQTTNPAPAETMAEAQESGAPPSVREGGGQ